MKISPSILAADLIGLRGILKEMNPSVIDLIHLDVMDGHFVPQLSFGESYSKAVKEATPIPLDVHLMVSNPEREVPKYFELAPHNITFHAEATNNPIRLAQSIRAEKIRAGICLNPSTPAGALEPLLDNIDFVLLMSVEPGFYGQKFIPAVMRKIRTVAEMIRGRDIELEVDGGIGPDNIHELAEAGVQICVAGAAVFKTGNVNDNAAALKARARG